MLSCYLLEEESKLFFYLIDDHRSYQYTWKFDVLRIIDSKFFVPFPLFHPDLTSNHALSLSSSTCSYLAPIQRRRYRWYFNTTRSNRFQSIRHRKNFPSNHYFRFSMLRQKASIKRNLITESAERSGKGKKAISWYFHKSVVPFFFRYDSPPPSRPSKGEVISRSRHGSMADQ